MERKYLVLISLFSATLIISTILLLPYLSSDTLLKNERKSSSEISSAFIISDSSSGTAPVSIQFKSLLQNFDENVKYNWDFGDGKSSFEANPIHVYDVKGTYNCTLHVSDDSSYSLDFVMITVYENNPPFVKIIVDKTSGNRPMTVNFDVDGFDTDGEIVSYDWEILYPPILSFQKVKNYDKKNFSERFLITGFYEVKLTVTDDNGKVATDYIKIQVLGHKIELMIKGGLFYISILDTVFQLYKNMKNFFVEDEPQTFIEKIRSFLEVNN